MTRQQFIATVGFQFIACFILALHAKAADLQKAPEKMPVNTPQLSALMTDAADWGQRREQIRAEWMTLLGPLPKERAPLNPKILKKEVLTDCTREYITYQIEDGVSTDGYWLVPKAAPPAGGFPVVVVFHPTTKSQAKEPAGIEVERPDRVHGLQLIARGYAVWCPRCYIFDEGADYKGNVAKVLARHPDWLGMTRLLYDAVRAADFVESRPEINKERMGCFGHSLGAKEALYAAAFDLRYKAAVFSEGGIGLSFSNWEAVWYLGEGIKKPGFGLDHHQLMALIAPRGFLILAGNSADDDRCWAYVDAVRPLYKQLGASDKIGWYNHELGHTYPPDAQRVAEEFLERCLKLN